MLNAALICRPRIRRNVAPRPPAALHQARAVDDQRGRRAVYCITASSIGRLHAHEDLRMLSVPALRPARLGVRVTVVDSERWSVGIINSPVWIEAASSQGTSSNTELRPSLRNRTSGAGYHR